MLLVYRDLALDIKDGYFWLFHQKKAIPLMRDRYFQNIIKIKTVEDLAGPGVLIDYQYENLYLKEKITITQAEQEFVFELQIISSDHSVSEIAYPGSLLLDKGFDILPLRQGLMSDRFSKDRIDLPFNGYFCSAAAYLPIIGQIDQIKGLSFLWIKDEPYDSRYSLDEAHKRRAINLYEMASLGTFERIRKTRLKILHTTNYNQIAAYYRQDVIKKGPYVTLKDKLKDLPKIDDLSKAAFIHTGIATKVQKTSLFYDPNDPFKNDHVTSFKLRQNEIHRYHKYGLDHFYVHLDGWGLAYDNGHPDPFPINREAGGTSALLELIRSLHNDHDLIGLHDQYRDLYFLSNAYNERLAVMDINGERYSHNRWAGGWQNYLCASLAPGFVKKNYDQLFKLGIQTDCAYLDVFTCNELDECFDKQHLMSRRDCAAYRSACFKEMIKRGIIPSSEEVNAIYVDSLVFAHYAPYDFMLDMDERKNGLPIPLFNLVYHDCFMIPWMMDIRKEDYMLYALLNGGLPYFKRDAAYPNVDGAFEGVKISLADQARRCKEVLRLYDQVKYQKMIEHQYLSADIQKTTFESGLEVLIDTSKGQYWIKNACEY